MIAYQPDGVHLATDTLVHFVSPDHHVKAVMTGPDGIASASTPPNSTIVVFTSATLIKIFVGTQPGDTVIAGRRRTSLRTEPTQVTFDLALHPQAAGYRLNVSCVAPISSVTKLIAVEIPAACPWLTNASISAWPVDAAGEPLNAPTVVRGANLSLEPSYQLQSYPFLTTFGNTHGITNVPATAISPRWRERYFAGFDALVTDFEVPLPHDEPVTMFSSSADWAIHTLAYTPAGGFGPVRLDHVRHSGGGQFAFDAAEMIRGIKNARYDAVTNEVRWDEDATGVAATLINARLTAGGTTIELHGPNDGSHAIALPTLSATVVPDPAIDLFGQRIIDELPADVVIERSYSGMLGDVDTNFDSTPVLWDPTFNGKVFEAHAP